MKTQIEIEKKYAELNQRMKDNFPTEDEIKKIRSVFEGNGSLLELITTMQTKSVDSLSVDAQRFILEWVLGHHD